MKEHRFYRFCAVILHYINDVTELVSPFHVYGYCLACRIIEEEKFAEV